MPTYETMYFQDELVISEGDEVVTAHISPSGTREGSSARNVALVRRSEDDTEGITAPGEDPICGHPVDGGFCQRTVETPQELCWQHEDE